MAHAHPESFEYTAAPIGTRRILVVDADGAEIRNRSGEVVDRVRYDQVLSARFVSNRARHVAMRRLDLETRDDTFRLSINCSCREPPDQPPLATYYEGCEALVTALAERKPGLHVELAESSTVRLIWFAMGLFALLIGLGLPIAALATRVDPDKLLAGLVPSAFLILLGGGIAWANHPWRKPAQADIADMPTLFRIMRGEEPTPPARGDG